jgi:hypothetical protein
MVKEDDRSVIKIIIKIEGQEQVAIIDTGASKSLIKSYVIGYLELVLQTSIKIINYARRTSF